jgi:hypothetical protein
MAAPTYDTDLTLLTACDATTGFTALGGGASGLGTGIDFAVQNSIAVDKQVTSTGALVVKGMIWDNGSTITPGSREHFLIWLMAGTPGTLTTFAAGGKRATIGTSTTAYMDFYLEGSDTRPKGGNKCYPIRYTTTGTATRVATGSPGANPQWFGGQLGVVAPAKGGNFGIDVMRRGSGFYITAGDSGTPATFAGAAAVNDGTGGAASTTRYGIIEDQGGGRFELQGRFVVGQQGNAGTPYTATAAYFVDSNASIVAVDTIHSATDYTQFIVDHASTYCELNAVSFTALGTNNPGQTNVVTTSTCPWTECSWTSWGVSNLNSGVTATNCVWRLCAAITQNSATIAGGRILLNTAAVALLVDDISKVTNVEFESDGTGHGIRYRPTGSGPFNVNLSGCQFSNYAASDGSTGNEAILIDPVTSTANITLNIVGGGTTPSIMLAAGYSGTFTLVVAPRTVTVHCLDVGDSSDIQGVSVWLAVSSGSGFERSVTIVQSAGTATVTDTGHPFVTNNVVLIEGANQEEYNGFHQITKTGANTYTYTVPSGTTSPATGTITSTLVVIDNELTDANGEVSDTRSWGGAQPVYGFAMKGTTPPTYKAQPITGSISASADTTIDVSMTGDD